MSKKQDKKGKKRSGPPRMSPAAVLRPRLDTLWANPAWPQGEESLLRADLSAVVRGTDAPFFLRTMLRAYQSASAPAQARLAQVLPGWLRDNGYLPELARIISEGSLEEASRDLALSWLQAGGGDTSALVEQEDTFYGAYYGGNEFQAVLIVLWYKDRRHLRVQGMSFLLDFNPPWEGAVKDVAIEPQRDSHTVMWELTTLWEVYLIKPETISAQEAAAKLTEALAHNRNEGIRLPADLISRRDAFQRYVLPLLSRVSEPAFTMDDFEYLSHTGRRPEDIMQAERIFGGRTRLPGGGEVLIQHPDAWDDD
ncbi:MAG: hypothetical protein ACUVWR_17825 [Anaerolineae bacterium]